MEIFVPPLPESHMVNDPALVERDKNVPVSCKYNFYEEMTVCLLSRVLCRLVFYLIPLLI